MKPDVKAFRDLEVYQAAFDLQQVAFRLTRQWPREEAYALTDQFRRCSRSIGANLAESWAKRRYPAHFLSKLTDADGELQESLHWIATASDCRYLSPSEATDLDARCESLGRSLGAMIAKHEKFCIR
jgi:four helix bundle protein